LTRADCRFKVNYRKKDRGCETSFLSPVSKNTRLQGVGLEVQTPGRVPYSRGDSMADDSENREDKGFKVRDRRRFSSESGEPVENAQSEAASQAPNQEPIIPPAEKKESTTDEALPAINFPTFIISLSTQALMDLGEIPNSLTGKVEKEIQVAKQTIDIISLLQEKTRGNLDQGEEKLMEHTKFPPASHFSLPNISDNST